MVRVLAMLALAVIGALPAQAQDTPPDSSKAFASQRGFQLGIQFGRTALGGRTESGSEGDLVIERRGTTAALRVGYQFTPQVALTLDMSGSSHPTNFNLEPANYVSMGLELRYQFVTGSRLQPFVMGGLGVSAVVFYGTGFESRITGVVALLGGGLQLHLSRHWRVELAARGDFINWSRREFLRLSDGERLSDPVSAEGSAARLGLGLVWAF